MAHVSQEKKAKLMVGIKQVLTAYGMKGSVSVRNHSTLAVTLSSGIIDFNASKNIPVGEVFNHELHNGFCVNHYYIEKYFKGAAAYFLTDLLGAMRGDDWFDDSDIQSDYFHTAHYTSIQIGKWNKTYVVK